MAFFMGVEACPNDLCAFIGWSSGDIFIAVARYTESYSIYIGIEQSDVFVGIELIYNPWHVHHYKESNVFIGMTYPKDGTSVFAGVFYDTDLTVSYFFGLLGVL
jgi:hypothetical protein